MEIMIAITIETNKITRIMIHQDREEQQNNAEKDEDLSKVIEKIDAKINGLF